MTTKIDKIEVGTKDKKSVSKLNNELFKEAVDVFNKSLERRNGKELGANWHIGYAQLGDFIDHLEENYEIKNK